jgi:hypothetical protein
MAKWRYYSGIFFRGIEEKSVRSAEVSAEIQTEYFKINIECYRYVSLPSCSVQKWLKIHGDKMP